MLGITKKKKPIKKLNFSRFNTKQYTALAVFLILFAGVGSYLLHHSRAYTNPDVTGIERFGINGWDTNPNNQVTNMPAYKALGVGWLRQDFPWTSLDNCSGWDCSSEINYDRCGVLRWNWCPWDDEVNAAQANGIKILGTLNYVPQWARQKVVSPYLQTYGNKIAAIPSLAKYLPSDWPNVTTNLPASDAQFALYAKTVAQHFGSKINAWEIWNEESIDCNWAGSQWPGLNSGDSAAMNALSINGIPRPTCFQADAATYTHTLKAAYDAIKSVNRNAIVITGGASNFGGPGVRTSSGDNEIYFLNGIYNELAKSFPGQQAFDGFGVHISCDTVNLLNMRPGTDDWCGWRQITDTNPSITGTLAAHGDSAKKIWVTETTAGTCTTSTSTCMPESQQAQQLHDSYQLAAKYSQYLGPTFWFNYGDSVPENDPSAVIHNTGGVVRSDGTKKPSWTTYHNCVVAVLNHSSNCNYRVTIAAGRSTVSLGSWYVTGCQSVSDCGNFLTTATSDANAYAPSPKPSIVDVNGNPVNGLVSWLYQQELWSMGGIHYSIPVPNGNYKVSLNFAEIYFNSPGQRKFNVAVQGTTRKTDFDILAAAGGKNKPTSLNYTVSVTNGALTIDLTPGSANYPKISWIDISGTQ